jgi:hypothetical protein
LIAAVGVNVFGAMANINYTYRLGFTLLPFALNFYWNRCRVEPYFKSTAFLDWCLQDRTARARVELDSYGLKKYMTKHRSTFEGLADKDGVIDMRKALAELQQLN